MTIETMRPADGGPERYEALDSLRGIAACWVVLFHMPSTGHLWPIAFFQHGFLAVTFFFILSGFVISISYGDKLSRGGSVAAFMLKRLGRIYPLHLFVIAVIFAYEIVRLALGLAAFRDGPPFTGNTALPDLFWNLALLQDAAPTLTWNRPSWSIGVEYWTYLLFALLLAALRARTLVRAALLLIAPALLQRIALKVMPLAVPHEIASLIDCAYAFGLGVLVFELRRSRFWAPVARLPGWAMTLVEVAIVALVIALSQTFGGRLSPLIHPVFALVVAIFAQQAGLLSRLLVTRPMLLIGALSYSIYMVHQFVQDRLMDLLTILGGPVTPEPAGRIVLTGPAWACDLAAVVMLLVVIAVANLTYRMVETPARLWSRDFVDRHIRRPVKTTAKG